jgi:hypothetical protein
MPKAPLQRHGHQPASYELGKVYCSPNRPRDKRKTRTTVYIAENVEQHRDLLRKLELLKQGAKVEAPLSDGCASQPTVADDEWVEELMETDSGLFQDNNCDDTVPNEKTKTNGATHRRITPDATANHLYSNWRSLIPTLVDSLLFYKNQTMGKVIAPLPCTLGECNRGCEAVKSSKILCLFLDREFPSPYVLLMFIALQTSGKLK